MNLYINVNNFDVSREGKKADFSNQVFKFLNATTVEQCVNGIEMICGYPAKGYSVCFQGEPKFKNQKHHYSFDFLND